MAATSLCSLPALRGARTSTTRRPSGALQIRAQSCAPRSIQRRQPDALLLSPFGSLGQMVREMEELSRAFDLPSATAAFPTAGSSLLACDLADHGDRLELQADLPGVAREDIKVTVSPGNVLTIAGERRVEREEGKEGEASWRLERSFGSFQRRFRLPDSVQPEGIQASLKDGVLRLTIPKAPLPEPKTVQVAVQGEEEHQAAAPTPAPEAAAAAEQGQAGAAPEAAPEQQQEAGPQE